MADQGTEGDHLLRYVILFATCPECHGSYDLEDVQAVKRRGNILWVVLKCSHCGSERIIVAYAHNEDDKKPEEIESPAEDVSDELDVPDEPAETLTPITEAEVQQWREFLASFDGDMEALLSGG